VIDLVPSQTVEIVENIKRTWMQYSGQKDASLIDAAFEFASEAHLGQKRATGEPYIIHPVAAAEILIDLELDEETIAAALLHDVVEDTDVTLDELRERFGPGIADLVDGVTKLSRLAYSSPQDQEEVQAENFRKMFLAMAKDIRVVLIKLADRLHNMRTMKSKAPDRQKRTAMETLDIYAPLAHRLGIYKIKWELEDLCLRYIDPDAYYELVGAIAQTREDREEYLAEIVSELSLRISETGITADIEGRPKHFYSIYRKMKSQNKSLEEIYDLFATRVIVPTVSDCYSALGVVHQLYKMMPGRFKDYIGTPKSNLYQSLHTTVIGPRGMPFEVQIRTHEMHRTAEYGIAAHWRYKEGTTDKKQDSLELKLNWLRQLLEWQSDMHDAGEFMDSLRNVLVTDEVFVFTPRGEVKSLPLGAGPIDFAYYIHSDVGNSMYGAKVNGRMVPLTYKLQNGDIVEILTSDKVHGPSRDWLSLVKSNTAKNKISTWFKREMRGENIERGREILEREIKKLGFQPSQLLKKEFYQPLLQRYSIQAFNDLLAAIGYGGISAGRIVPRLRDDYVRSLPEAERNKLGYRINKLGHVIYSPQSTLLEDRLAVEPKPETREQRKKRNARKTGITVTGLDIDNVMVKLPRCCSPVPGDKIIGYVTRGAGVTVHRTDCPNVRNLLDSFDRSPSDAERASRLIDVSWTEEMDTNRMFPVDMQIIARDRKNLLLEVSNAIAEESIRILSAKMRSAKDISANMQITVEVANQEQYDRLVGRIKAVRGIVDVQRRH
jgi:guanosine-3',5'-bis(diphosphate) 3'-pyrophosphohydrolase